MDDNDLGWSALKRASVAIHELFVTLMSTGFTEDQALKLVSMLLLQSNPLDD